MKISEIEVKDVKNYLNIFHDEDDTLIRSILFGAKSYIKSYTGLSTEALDRYDDLSIAVFVVVSELYDNRSMQMDKTAKANPLIETILGLHSINLI
jgi:uncharacterized phage protein (predicted DNA packaging)